MHGADPKHFRGKEGTRPMTHIILHERVGKPMRDNLRGPDGKPVIVKYGCRVNGLPEGRKVDLEYGMDSVGAVHVDAMARTEDGEPGNTGQWGLDAISNRDARGLHGFVDFAKSIGIQGHQLVRLIEEHNRCGI